MLRKEHEIGATVWAIWCNEQRHGKMAAKTKKTICLQHGEDEYATLQTYDPEHVFDDEAAVVSAVLARLNNELSRTHAKIKECLQRMTVRAGVKSDQQT